MDKKDSSKDEDIKKEEVDDLSSGVENLKVENVDENGRTKMKVENKDGNKDETKKTCVVFTKGVCPGNDKPPTATAGWGMYWGEGNANNKFGPVQQIPNEIVPREQRPNRANYIAARQAIETAILQGFTRIVIKTDLKLLINSFTGEKKWINKWKTNGWKTLEGGDVLHQDVLKEIDELMGEIEVEFVKVDESYSGNKKAKELAKEGVKQGSEQMAEQGAEQVAEQGAEQVAEQGAEQGSEQGAEQEVELPPIKKEE